MPPSDEDFTRAWRAHRTAVMDGATRSQTDERVFVPHYPSLAFLTALCPIPIHCPPDIGRKRVTWLSLTTDGTSLGAVLSPYCARRLHLHPLDPHRKYGVVSTTAVRLGWGPRTALRWDSCLPLELSPTRILKDALWFFELGRICSLLLSQHPSDPVVTLTPEGTPP